MLENYIKSSGKTRAEWAELLGISRGYLSLLLSGDKLPSLTLAAKIERVTGREVMASSWISDTDASASAPPDAPQTEAAE